ncbi:MAG TPA: oligosaccharide flippase family protein [Armatimonadota bacterium]
MSRTQRAADNSILNLLAWVWPLALNLLFTRYALQSLGPQLYGAWVVLLANLGFCAFLDLGLPVASVKYLSEMVARRQMDYAGRVLGAALFVYVIVGVVGVGLVSLLTPLVLSGAKGLPPALIGPTRLTLFLLAASLWVNILSTLLASVPLALQLYSINTRIVLLSNSATTLAMIAALKSGHSIVMLGALTLAGSLVGLALYVHSVHQLVPGLRWRPKADGEYLRKLFGFGLFTSLNGVSSGLFNNLDRVLITRRFGLPAAALYGPSAQLANRVQGVASSLTNVVFPMTSEMSVSGDLESLNRLYLRAVRLTAAVCTALVVPLATLSGIVLTLWLGAAFAQKTAGVLAVLMCSFYLASYTAVPFHVYNGLGKPHINTLFSFCVAGVNAALCVVLIPRYGLLGGAVASLGSMGAVPFYNVYLETKLLKVSPLRTLKRAYFPVWIVGAAQALILHLVSRHWHPGGLKGLALIVGGGLLFPVLYVALGVAPKEDRDLVSLYAHRLTRRISG